MELIEIKSTEDPPSLIELCMPIMRSCADALSQLDITVEFHIDEVNHQLDCIRYDAGERSRCGMPKAYDTIFLSNIPWASCVITLHIQLTGAETTPAVTSPPLFMPFHCSSRRDSRGPMFLSTLCVSLKVSHALSLNISVYLVLIPQRTSSGSSA